MKNFVSTGVATAATLVLFGFWPALVVVGCVAGTQAAMGKFGKK